MTDALFDLPQPEPLRKPHLPAGKGKVVYAKYTSHQPYKCDDCMRVLYEANQAGTSAPPARQARCSRTQGKDRRYLCAEHKNLRERDELEQAVLKEIYLLDE